MSSARDAVVVGLCLLALVAWFGREAPAGTSPPGYAAALEMIADDSVVVDALGGPGQVRSLRGWDRETERRYEYSFMLDAPVAGVRVRLDVDTVDDGWRPRELTVFGPDTTYIRYWGYPELPDAPLPPPSPLMRARRAFHAGDHDAALALVERALRTGSDSAAALAVRGWVLQARGQFPQALGTFEAAYALDSGDYEVLYGLANELGRARRYRESIRTMDRAILLYPDRASAYYVRAIGWGKLDNEARQAADLRASCFRGYETACDVLDHHGIGR